METQPHRQPTYRIAIADDHAVVRLGVRCLLEVEPEFEICGEASNGIEAIECSKHETPDLLVLDMTMPGKNGLEVAQFLHKEMPSIAILVLSMHFSPELARELFREGVRGYVLKAETDVVLVEAVRKIRTGKLFCSRELADSMVNSFSQEDTRNHERELAAQSGSRLTARETEIVTLLVKGCSNKEVASTIRLSVRTVEAHRSHIVRKMKFTNFSEMVKYAIRAGLMEV